MRDSYEEYKALEADARDMLTPEYREGWQAYLDGETDEWANPYSEESGDYFEWRDGWQAAKQTEEEAR